MHKYLKMTMQSCIHVYIRTVSDLFSLKSTCTYIHADLCTYFFVHVHIESCSWTMKISNAISSQLWYVHVASIELLGNKIILIMKWHFSSNIIIFCITVQNTVKIVQYVLRKIMKRNYQSVWGIKPYHFDIMTGKLWYWSVSLVSSLPTFGIFSLLPIKHLLYTELTLVDRSIVGGYKYSL